MSRLNYKNGLNFDIYIMDLCDAVEPTSATDLSELSIDLHERIENSILDYIYDNKLNLDEYEGAY